MKSRHYIIIVISFLTSAIYAQDQSQALRFSQIYPVGTARYTSMGGAFGAIGGDFSSASQNPAGLGLYRGSEFTITPSYTINNSKSKYLGETNKDNATNFSIANLGMVSTYASKRESGIVGATVAFGYNALNNFSSSTLMRGINNNSSLLDNFAWYANNSNELDGFYEDLAHQTALMPLDTVQNNYWHYLEPYDAIGYEGYGEEQVRILERSGYLGEYVFSAALNLSNKLYVGGTMGIHALRFSEEFVHRETDVDDLEPDFNSFRFGEYNTTRGYGSVFKLGIIYKPIHILRIGASFHLPIVYQLTDDKYTDIDAYWDSNSGINDDSQSSGTYSKRYTLRTPYRASFSTAVLIGDMGLISAEYEYVDYSSSDLDSPGYKFIDENIAISKDFTNAHNLKAGAEIRLNPAYFRVGAQYYMNPFKDDRNGSDIFVYSGGIGLRSNQTFFDIAYSLTSSKELYGLYHFAPEFEEGFEKSVNSYNRSNIMLTIGYKF